MQVTGAEGKTSGIGMASTPLSPAPSSLDLHSSPPKLLATAGCFSPPHLCLLVSSAWGTFPFRNAFHWQTRKHGLNSSQGSSFSESLEALRCPSWFLPA